jgi:shikimate dehydrogenase
MSMRYAEVIGDPVDHSKSPLIHRFWLEKLGLEGDYRARTLGPDALPAYLAERCADPLWRGCNVTAPLKARAARLAIDPTGVCARIGAANAIFRSPLRCGVGANTDLHGIAEALGASESLGDRICVIGAGGAARAVLEFFRVSGTAEVSMIVRDVGKGRAVHGAFDLSGGVCGFDDCATAIAGAECLVNATPLGMSGQPPMPRTVLDCLADTAEDALVFDMIYAPLETELLRNARTMGRNTADGLTMLIGQAAPAFELFFGVPAPREHDAELREALAS